MKGSEFFFDMVTFLYYKYHKINLIYYKKFFVNKYNWKSVDYSSGTDGWKNFERNNTTIAINMVHEKVCENKNACGVLMAFEDTRITISKIIDFNPY